MRPAMHTNGPEHRDCAACGEPLGNNPRVSTNGRVLCLTCFTVADQFSKFETYPEKFGAAMVVIERLQRQIAYLSGGLRDIRDHKWSGTRCRDSAGYTLDRLKNV